MLLANIKSATFDSAKDLKIPRFLLSPSSNSESARLLDFQECIVVWRSHRTGSFWSFSSPLALGNRRVGGGIVPHRISVANLKIKR
jgi:hypothetical protein